MAEFEHMGLFEGIGGFSLAAGWAGWHTPVMVEWNPYCQAVLKKNFPDATIFSDIRNFNGRPYAGKIDIITGGFPCQPFSHAGKLAGTDDDRYLWPEMLRIITEVKPAWIVGENVAGLISMDGGRVLEGILIDLENAGYTPEVFVIPAVAVGAPHRRDRVWIVAHANGGGVEGSVMQRANVHSGSIKGPLANTLIGRRQRGQDNEGQGQAIGIGAKECYWAVADACKPGFPGQQFAGALEHGARASRSTAKQNCNDWCEHWYEVATRICGVDDGIPGWVDGTAEIPAKKNTGKAQRLEGLGNAIVPHVAYQIFEAIKTYYASNI